MKRILIDLNVVTVADWDKKKEAIEFLEKTREDYEVYTPLTFLYRILREWKYKKLADRIFKKFDKITEIFLQEYKTTKICLEKYGMTLRHLTNVLSKKLGIKEEDASLVIYASISEVDYVVTYNRKDLRNIEREIKKFLKERGMHVFEIKLPEELLSSNTSLNLLQSFLCFLPSFSLPSFSNLVSFKLFNTFSFSHISKLQLRLFKVLSADEIRDNYLRGMPKRVIGGKEHYVRNDNDFAYTIPTTAYNLTDIDSSSLQDYDTKLLRLEVNYTDDSEGKTSYLFSNTTENKYGLQSMLKPWIVLMNYQANDQPLFITTSRKTLSAIPLKVTATEDEKIIKLTFNQSFSSNTNLTLAYGYLGTVNTRSDTG